MIDTLKILLLQMRNPKDPMRAQEVACFQRVLRCRADQITPCDLREGIPSASQRAHHDLVLIGGSGHYSATSLDSWIDPILDLFRELHALSQPTFASCWGFQAMARAMGGRVVHDLDHAELGTHPLRLTDAGRIDPVFGPLGDGFLGQMGHEDRVVDLPDDAVLLASTERVENQAYRFDGKPIYCTQFHPEMNRDDLLGRVEQYPEYIYRIEGISPDRFGELLSDAPETESILRRFVQHVFGMGY